MISLQDEPATDGDKHNDWTIANAKTKSKIVLYIGDSALAKTSEIFHGDGTAEQLWDELGRIFTISSTQAAANLQGRLEVLRFKDGEDWDKHVSYVLSIVHEFWHHMI